MTAAPGDTVDALGFKFSGCYSFHVSARAQADDGPQVESAVDATSGYISLRSCHQPEMQLSGMSVRVEPRNMMNQFVPQPLRLGVLRDPTNLEVWTAQRVPQGAVPDPVL